MVAALDHDLLRPTVRPRATAQRTGKCSGVPQARRDGVSRPGRRRNELPVRGDDQFEGMEELPDLLCDPRSLRDGYLEALEEYLVEVRRGCSRMGIDYSLIKTSDYMDAILSKFLHRRMASSSGGAKATISIGLVLIGTGDR